MGVEAQTEVEVEVELEVEVEAQVQVEVEVQYLQTEVSTRMLHDATTTLKSMSRIYLQRQ